MQTSMNVMVHMIVIRTVPTLMDHTYVAVVTDMFLVIMKGAVLVSLKLLHAWFP